MIILDTTIWIEFLRNNSKYYPKICKLLENQEVLAVECVFGELLQGIKSKQEKEVILAFWEHLPHNNYVGITIEAGLYSFEKKLIDKGLGLIDAIILLYGIKSNSKIWTLDAKFLRIIPEELKYKNEENIETENSNGT